MRFTADFDFKPKSAVTQAFRKGETRLVTTACALAASAAERAVRVEKPKEAGNG